MVNKTISLLLFIIAYALGIQLNAQNIDSVKADNSYMWGQGKAKSLQRADRYALRDLTSQISTRVESDYKYIITEEEGITNEFLEGIVKTYSSATLNHAQRIVHETPDGVVVLRYMKKNEIGKIFENRGKKIIGYVSSAIEAENEYRMGDALRYFYWAQCLLFSHPDNQQMVYTYNGVEHYLYSWLPNRINRIFTLIQINVTESIEKNNSKELLFDVNYKNKQAYNLDYSYWNGSDWSSTISAPNGNGIIQLFGDAECAIEKIRLKIEYQYLNKSRLDPELHDVVEVTELPYYKKAVKYLKNENSTAANTVAIEKPEKPIDNPANLIHDNSQNCFSQQKAIDNVNVLLRAIANKNHVLAQQHCTHEGYAVYKQLMQYGNAKRLKSSINLKYICIGDKAIVRSVPFKFSFANNNQQFIENICFTVNSQGKISNMNFALNELSINGILSHSKWSNKSKWHIIYFMENYKTAYALERIDYIEKIFADNALIIVGKKLEKAEQISDMYVKALSNDDYTYMKFSKKEYIERLDAIFNSNEFVNIQFEECNVRKRSRDSEIYGIQIAQNYYSTNYADKGYLFLMIDLTDTVQPKIYVRSWQPEKNEDGSIIGLGAFFN